MDIKGRCEAASGPCVRDLHPFGKVSSGSNEVPHRLGAKPDDSAPARLVLELFCGSHGSNLILPYEALKHCTHVESGIISISEPTVGYREVGAPDETQVVGSNDPGRG